MPNNNRRDDCAARDPFRACGICIRCYLDQTKLETCDILRTREYLSALISMSIVLPVTKTVAYIERFTSFDLDHDVSLAIPIISVSKMGRMPSKVWQRFDLSRSYRLLQIWIWQCVQMYACVMLGVGRC